MTRSAAEATTDAIHAFNYWRADAMLHLKDAFKQDAEYPLAQAVKGLILATGRNTNYQGMVDACLQCARDGQESIPVSQRRYVDALDALARGELTQAVTVYEQILAQYPTDLFVHRLAQQELFWMGEARWMADIAESSAAAWSEADKGYGMFLSVHAFALEEAGDRARAERLARQAVELDAGDLWGAHAVAHVLEMQGRVDEGIDWLRGLHGNWAGGNQIVHHLWWHMCLFLLERGEHAQILEIFDAHIRNMQSSLVIAVPDVYIDIQNVASLLMRLELRGVDVGARWSSVAEVAQQRIDNHATAFTDAHAVMILAACGEFDNAATLLNSMKTFAMHCEGSLGPRYSSAAIPAARAAIAHRRGDHRAVVNALLPARRALWQMGGSHAQRDVYSQLLVDSLMKLGEHRWLATVLAEQRAVPFEHLEQRTLYADAVALLSQ
jgi:tetratricopeptide (TPR) repeat protein